ncbi:malonyl CoA-acyl carrier protein transacylase fabD2 [Streptomyces lincolnensis]|uniref:Malonyl CoA-acyl carrier protein transacylase fabD2 n=1 Tax=Streptomyces lincolnensis TaxID=1915 RepID=A0A1B1MJC5_STRLN|nr:malonyl CoA-ACP transacylase [Streptomyces lincolnensis]ANS68701.1 malonyl CoA-acyl carrier protein transacylase fabD2 [Streptomyces lincolnensis]AXG53093.1 malonyl CoA-acyl carrier protein transacylase fabD2 [Streptomyces lincolnensis]QMV10311.1 peptidyl-prolyl cis-trans isomerase [Streptomyces lincolnensis]
MTDYAALVHGERLPKARVDAVLNAVPARDTETRSAERQRRRWATQVAVIDELAQRACEERGLTGAPQRGAGNCATSHDGPAPAQRHSAAPSEERTALTSQHVADLGSIVAVALAHSPAARTLLSHLEHEQPIPETAVHDYYARNPDRFLTPAALRRGVDPFGDAPPDDFLPYEQAREGIARELRRAAGRRAFFDWLDRARAGVVYAHGYEHPGDPSHPDHEHRH